MLRKEGAPGRALLAKLTPIDVASFSNIARALRVVFQWLGERLVHFGRTGATC